MGTQGERDEALMDPLEYHPGDPLPVLPRALPPAEMQRIEVATLRHAAWVANRQAKGQADAGRLDNRKMSWQALAAVALWLEDYADEVERERRS